MAQMAKSMIEVEIGVSADKIFQALKATSRSVPKLSPDKILNVEEQDGCTKNWTLSVDGKVEKMKERVEVDDENKSMTVFVFEGDVMEHYRSFKCSLRIIPKLHGSIARWSWEYEKLHSDSPAPNKYMDFAVNLTKDIESNLRN
ncbi:PREDICTED: major latex protein 146 [Tarenaya hassleriana]|uniref:major latex protein 146 n=1 Tax=Tarenaya hassleriana TaxID=28532 RepID=UPI00053C3348|nr:PREDICTED: major latex protein 146 [Tarenaya hassleriana]XP_010552707.1 PREDICTED: major latex protein 146 [Tarenaya hassleriana]